MQQKIKIEAINQITRLTEEESLKEILKHLSKLYKQPELNLSHHYNEIKEYYRDVEETCSIIFLGDVLTFHDFSIEDFGGSKRWERYRFICVSNCKTIQTCGDEDL